MPILHLALDDGTPVSCDTSSRTITCLEKKAVFTEAEWILLKGLYFQNGKAVSRKALLALLPTGIYRDDTRVVDVHVSSIRAKLKKIKVARIKAIYGVGYQLAQSHIR